MVSKAKERRLNPSSTGRALLTRTLLLSRNQKRLVKIWSGAVGMKTRQKRRPKRRKPINNQTKRKMIKPLHSRNKIIKNKRKNSHNNTIMSSMRVNRKEISNTMIHSPFSILSEALKIIENNSNNINNNTQSNTITTTGANSITMSPETTTKSVVASTT